MSRIQVRDGFLVLMAALWCADESGVLPIFLLAAAVHECGHLFVIRLSGGTVHALCLTACGAVLRCSLPPSPFSRAAICLAGPAASFALTALANPLGAYRLAGASALLGLFNLLPVPPLDGGMALRHLADGRFTRLLNGIAGVSVLVLLAGGVLLWRAGSAGGVGWRCVSACNRGTEIAVSTAGGKKGLDTVRFLPSSEHPFPL